MCAELDAPAMPSSRVARQPLALGAVADDEQPTSVRGPRSRGAARRGRAARPDGPSPTRAGRPTADPVLGRRLAGPRRRSGRGRCPGGRPSMRSGGDALEQQRVAGALGGGEEGSRAAARRRCRARAAGGRSRARRSSPTRSGEPEAQARLATPRPARRTRCRSRRRGRGRRRPARRRGRGSARRARRQRRRAPARQPVARAARDPRRPAGRGRSRVERSSR